MDNKAITVTDETFEQEVKNHTSQPVLVDFWAPWCGPCKQMLPIIEEFYSENADKVKVCTVNVDDNPRAAGEMGVRGIPTLVLFLDGENKGIKVGVQSKEALAEWVFAE